MQGVNLIVSCTNRKKAVVPEELRLRSLADEPSLRRLELWLDRLKTHDVASRRAAELYAGDHWQVARSIPREAAEANLDVRLWVCSAGYGLVRPSDVLKPYSATFTPGHPDSVTVSAGAKSDTATREWWAGLIARPGVTESPRGIAELAAGEPHIPIVLVASTPYLLAMTSDLVDATRALVSEDLLSVLSIGARSKRLARLGARLLPADARFETLVGGTRVALNARVARLVLRRLPKGTLPSRERLERILEELAADLPPLRRFDRRKLSDHQVRRYIVETRRADPTVSKTHLLRRLRASGGACEQSRFSEIFTQAVG